MGFDRSKRIALGVLYMASGLVCELIPQLPQYPARRAAFPGEGGFSLEGILWNVGATLLIFSGLTSVFETIRGRTVYVLAAVAASVSLGLFNAPIFGAYQNPRFGVAPTLLCFLIASLIVLVIERRWVLSAIGSALSIPAALHGLGAFSLYSAWAGGTGGFTLRMIYFPIAFALASLGASLIFRIP